MNTVSVWHAGAPTTSFPSLARRRRDRGRHRRRRHHRHHAGGAARRCRPPRGRARGAARRRQERPAIPPATCTASSASCSSCTPPGTPTPRAASIQSRLEAVSLVENIARRLPVDCSFSRVPQLIYAVDAGAQDGVRAEYDVVRQLGLPCAIEEARDLPHAVGAVLTIENTGAIPAARVRARARRARRFGQLPDLRGHACARDRRRQAHRAHRTRDRACQRDRARDAYTERHLRPACGDDGSSRIRRCRIGDGVGAARSDQLGPWRRRPFGPARDQRARPLAGR